MKLTYTSPRWWIRKVENDGYTSYILSTAFRPDNWILIENVYPEGDVVAHWRYFDAEFDFGQMKWFKKGVL